MKRYLFIVTMLAIFFTSCKKNSNNNTQSQTPYDTIAQQFLDYAQLKVGNFYIYKDSVNNSLDSVVVTESTVTKKLLYDNTGTCVNPSLCITQKFYYDKLDLVLQTIDNIGNKSNWFTAVGPVVGDQVTLVNDSGDVALVYPFKNQGSLIVHSIASVAIENNVYSNVMAFENEPYSNYYWVLGVGIIKRSHTSFDGKRQTWTLVRHG